MLCIILVSRCVPGCSQMILKFWHWILVHSGMILCKFTVVTIFNIDRGRHELLCEGRVLELWFSLFYHHLRVWVRWNTQNHPIHARETHKIRNGLNRWMDFLLNARFDFSFWRLVRSKIGYNPCLYFSLSKHPIWRPWLGGIDMVSIQDATGILWTNRRS